MKGLAELLNRIETYERNHADWVSAQRALQDERDSIIASLGMLTGAIMAELPRVPAIEIGAGQAEAVEISAEAASAQIPPDSKPCSEMTDDELVIGFVDICRRYDEVFKRLRDGSDGGHGGSPGEWFWERCGEFDTAISKRGLTPRQIGAACWRLNIAGNHKPYEAGTPEAKEFTAGWLDEQAKTARPVIATNSPQQEEAA